MSLPKRLLVATDFSKQADNAGEVALEWAVRFGAELHWTHGVERLSDVTPPRSEPLIASYVEQARHAGQEKLTAAAAEARARGLVSEGHLIDAPVAPSVAQLARKLEADCVVVGTHGHTGLSHILLGSVAERIVREAPCRVLAVRGEGSPLPDRSIVLGDALTSESAPARADAEALAREFGAKLDVLHAVEAGIYLSTLQLVLPKGAIDGLAEEASQKLAEAAAASPGIEFANKVVKERPADAICDRAGQVGANLIVVGSRARHGVDRVLMGSVAERVVRYAACSVLVAR